MYEDVSIVVNTDGTCAFLCLGFFFSFNNQTIVYICVLARSHKEEHPNKGEKSQTGKMGWKENPDSRLWVPMDQGFKVHRGGRGDKEREGDFERLPGDTKMVTSEVSLYLVSRCRVILKSPGWKAPETLGQWWSHRQRLGLRREQRQPLLGPPSLYPPPPPQTSPQPRSHWRKEGAEPYLTWCPGPGIDRFYFCSQPTGEAVPLSP